MLTPLRADVVGSLLRPDAVRQARADFRAGLITRDQLTAAEDAAVRYLVELQRDCGLPVVTDGEVRRGIYLAPLTEGLHGVTEVPQGRVQLWRDAHGNTTRVETHLAVTDRISLRESVAVNEFRFTRSVSPVPVKVTVPSPLGLLSRWSPQASSAAYPDPFELCADTAVILRGIIADLIELGCRYIQFDIPELTNVIDVDYQRELAALGISSATLVDVGCDLVNQLASTERDDVRFALHLCRGNNNGLFLKSGGYEGLIATLYERVPNVSTLMLEFDDERSGGFEPLRGAPADKVLVLGLVSTKVPELEAREALIARIEQAASYVPIEQLAISTQCGFASTTSGVAPLSEADERAKLSLVADVARAVWGRDKTVSTTEGSQT